MRKPLFLFLFPFFLVSFSYGQQVFIGGKEGNRKLTWSDFGGQPDPASPYFANTRWNLGFGYSGVRFSGDTAFLQGLTIKLELDSAKSWVRKGKETEALLKHEQGHFDLGLLCLQEITQTIKNTTFLRNTYQSQIRSVFNEAFQKYHALGRKYDEETNHSINKETQEKWNAFFAAEKQKAKIN